VGLWVMLLMALWTMTGASFVHRVGALMHKCVHSVIHKRAIS
jgi:hypothetical protein